MTQGQNLKLLLEELLGPIHKLKDLRRFVLPGEEVSYVSIK